MNTSVVLISLALVGFAEAFVSKVNSNAYVNTRSLVGIDFTTVHADIFTSSGNFRINFPNDNWDLKDCFLAENYNNPTKRRSHYVKAKMKKDKSIGRQYIEGDFDIGNVMPRSNFKLQCVVDAPGDSIVVEEGASNASASLTFSNSLASTPSDANYIVVTDYNSIGGVSVRGSGSLSTPGSGLFVDINGIAGDFRSVVVDGAGELTFGYGNAEDTTNFCQISGDDIGATASIIAGGSNDKLLLTFTAPTTRGRNYHINCKGIAVQKSIPWFPVQTSVVGTFENKEYKAFSIASMENSAAMYSVFASAAVVAAAIALFL